MKRKYLISTVVSGLSVMLFFMMLPVTAFAAEHVVLQQSKSFRVGGNKIEEMTVKVGDTITFKNDDPFFHNIYSLSDLKSFDLGSYPKGESKSVVFDKAGLAEVECAIHPEMYLEVTVK